MWIKLKSMTSSMNILRRLWMMAKTSIQQYWSLLFWLPSSGKHHLIFAITGSHKKDIFCHWLFWFIMFWLVSYCVALIQEPTWTLLSLWPWWSWGSCLWRSSLCTWRHNSWALLLDPALSMAYTTVGLMTYYIITTRELSHEEGVIWITSEILTKLVIMMME